VLYFNRAQDNDLALSQAALTSSYDARKALGDLIGQMRILRNLSVLVFALAKEAKDWDAAEEKYLEIETLAERLEEDAPMQADDRALHLVNRLDLKIVRGDLVAARGLLDSAKTQPGIDDNTLILLLINQAKLALSEGDAETCHVYLARVLEAIEGGKHIVNNLEWIELTLEGHLLLDMPIDTARISPILAQQQPTDTYQSEAASWLFSEGLLAFILGDYSRAMGSLAQSRTLWKEVGYRYREATTALWQVDLLYRQGEIDSAHSIGYETQALLLPFGSTPALARLHKLQEM
jgi:hypothetical protein